MFDGADRCHVVADVVADPDFVVEADFDSNKMKHFDHVTLTETLISSDDPDLPVRPSLSLRQVWLRPIRKQHLRRPFIQLKNFIIKKIPKK